MRLHSNNEELLQQIPFDILMLILLYAGDPKYFGRFAQLNKALYSILTTAHEKGPTQNYWRDLYRRDYVKNAKKEFTPPVDFKNLYKNAAEARKQSFDLSKEYRQLFNSIRSGDLESIKQQKWNAENFFNFFSYSERKNAIELASLYRQNAILNYFYEECCIRLSLMGATEDSKGRTKFYYALACNKLSEVDAQKNNQVINQVFKTNETPLYVAARFGHFKMVQLLIQAGANVNLGRPDTYDTPLYNAIQKGYVDIVQILIEAGANLDLISPNCVVSPLYLATKKRNLEIVRLLIEAGANVNQVLIDCDFSPLYTAVSKGSLDIAKLLIAAGASIDQSFLKNNLLYTAVQNGYLDIVQFLITMGEDVNQVRKANRSTLLYTAIHKGFPEVVRTLVAAGANPNLAFKDSDLTALHVAVEKENLDIVRILIEAGANVNIAFTENDNITPLYTAARNGSFDIVQLLIAAGADVNHVYTYDNTTPLYIAAKKGHLKIVELLVKAGAVFEDNTVQAIAAKSKQSDVFVFLKLWQLKNILKDKPLPEKVIGVLKTSISTKESHFSQDTFFSKNITTEALVEELKGLDDPQKDGEEKIIRLLKQNCSNIPEEKYKFIFEHLLEDKVQNDVTDHMTINVEMG